MTIQDLSFQVSTYADTNGNATFTFQVIPVSQTWTFTITVPGAEDTAVHSAVSGGTTYAQFKGSNAWGPIQLGVSDQLVITSTGLVPGNLYTALMDGVAHTVTEPPIVWPQPYADSVTTSTQQIVLKSAQYPSGTAPSPLTYTIPVPPSYRSLYVAVANTVVGGGAGPSITVTGVQSGVTYQAFSPPYLNSLVNTSTGANWNIFQRYAVVQGLDTSVTVTITNAAAVATSTTSIAIGADLATVDTLVYGPGSLPADYSQSPTGTVAVGQLYTSNNTAAAIPTGYGVVPNFDVVFGGSATAFVQLTSTAATAILPSLAGSVGKYYRLHAVTITGGAATQFVQFSDAGFNVIGRVPVQGTTYQFNGQLYNGSPTALYATLTAFTLAVNVWLTYYVVWINTPSL